MNQEQAIAVLEGLPFESGYAYDMIQHFLDFENQDPDGDVGFGLPNCMEAGDLFRTLVLDEHYAVEEAENVYDAAMVIVYCADKPPQRLAS